MLILRALYLINISFIFILIIKKIIMHKSNRNIEIYFSGWIFGTALLVSMMFNVTFFMSDIVVDSWNNLNIENTILLILMNVLNTFVTFVVYIGTKKRIDIISKSFILYKLFSKKEVKFIDIDIEKSEYIFVSGKSSKISPKKGIFTSGEYFNIILKSGEKIEINMNPLLFSGNRILLLTVVVKELKIKRKLL